MEEKAPAGPTMVSRLPKFGGRPSPGSSNPHCNGFTQQSTIFQDGKPASLGVCFNGGIRPSPLLLSLKRDEGINRAAPTMPNNSKDGTENKAVSQFPVFAKDVKNYSPATPKMRKSGSLMVAVSSPKAVPKQTLKTSPKSRAEAIQSSLGGISKVGSNGSSIPARTGSESRLARPLLGSCSPRSISQDSLPQSIDDLKKQTLDSIVRSNSFTHFKQIPSPTGEPMTRSFSFNRAVELAKPLANTQLRPPRSSLLKLPQLSNGRVILGINGNHGSPGFLGGGTGGLQYGRNPQLTNSLPNPSASQSTPRAFKKPLLPCSMLSNSLVSTGPVGCRMGQTKHQMSPLPEKVKDAIGTSAFAESEGLLKIAVNNDVTETNACSSNSESDGSPGNEVINDEESAFSRQSFCQAAAETLEDMSLSSASSLDRCDTSEELLDDLDYVQDELYDGEISNNRKCGSTTKTPVDEAVELDLTNLPETEEESPMQDSQGPLVISSEQGEAQQASSVEISPSNSSGGTYMWDEEGLQPLGIHETQSLDYDDSELNSMDILNNLDPLRAGDLDDDDLILDVDLPEDGFHDFDSMSQFEHLERGSRQGQRRNQRHWNGQQHLHNDNRAHVFCHYDGLKASRTSSRPVQSKGMQHEYRPVLDELTLEHMSQDCNLLKNQLLRLKMLLQLEETDRPGDISDETEDRTSTAQLDALMKEVQELREELRSRDKTIAQLTTKCQQLQQLQQEQMSFPEGQITCQCRHQRAPSSLRPHSGRQGEKLHHYDKATQTHWRPPNHAPQILQPFKPRLIEPSHRERPVRTLPIEGLNKVTQRTSEEVIHADDCPPEALVADVCWAADPDKLTHRLSTNMPCLHSCTPQEITAKDSPASAQQCAAQHGCKSLAVITHDSVAPRSAGLTCPCTLAPPHLHKRMQNPSSKPGGAGGSPKAPCFAGSSANRAKQLPPPSRGLPCFNAGPWVQTQKLFSTSLTHPLRTSEPRKDSWHTNAKSLEEPTQATLRDPGSAKTLIPLRRSCLPKPKIP